MTKPNPKEQILRLERELKALREENELLVDRVEDVFVLGTISDLVSEADTATKAITSVIEVLTALKEMECCAYLYTKGNDLKIGECHPMDPQPAHSVRTLPLTTDLKKYLNGEGKFIELIGLKEVPAYLAFHRFSAPPTAANFLPLKIKGLQRSAILTVDCSPGGVELKKILPLLDLIGQSLVTRLENIILLEDIHALNQSLEQKVEVRTQSLKESEEKFRLAFSTSPDSININRLKDGLYIDVNDGFTKITGYTRDKTVGKTSKEINIWADLRDRQKLVEKLKKSEGVNSLQAKFRMKDGRIIDGQMSAVVINLGGVPHIISITRDISKQVANEKHKTRLIERQKAITRLSLEIGQAKSLKDIFPAIKREISSLVHSPALFISLFDRESEMITPVYINIEGEELDINEFPPIHFESANTGLQSQVISSGKSVIFNNWHNSKPKALLNFEVDEKTREIRKRKIDEFDNFPRAGLLVPMKSSGEVQGVFMIQSLESHTYTQGDLDFLEGVANVTAVAVQNLKLVSDLDNKVSELAAANEHLQGLFSEKEVLLKEVHHRIKNNLQVVSSLLNMQLHSTEDAEAREILRESKSRIRSMALIHERLYKSDDQASIAAGNFIKVIADELFMTYEVGSTVRLETKIEDVALDISTAIPCGLVINELLSNALKYAFPADRKGTISLSLEVTGNGLLNLRISDDGVGLPEDFDFEQSTTLGMTLVRILAIDQLDATLDIDGKNGTTFDLTFPIDQS